MWTRAEIGGKPADVFDPPKVRFGVLFLHPVGGETLAGNEAWTAQLLEHGLACACPITGVSWWRDEGFLIDEVLPWMRSRWGVRNIALLGISMGGQGALRLAFKHPETFPVVAGIASAIDFHEWYGRGTPLDDMYDSKEQARQDTATLHIHPSKHPPHVFFCVDPHDREWWRGNDRLHEKLAALGVAHECDLTTKAGGHSWTYFDAMAERAVRFIAAGLEEQARRVM